MGEFKNVSILLPALNETFSFIKTMQIILDTCRADDIREIIAIVCEHTTKECLQSIDQAKKMSELKGVEFRLLWQHTPYAGGAVRDGMDLASGTHTLMMAPDLETDPTLVQEFIHQGRKYPNDMITASRWLKKGSFEGYSRIKLILNFMFQKIFSLFYNVKLTDITYGYRLAPTALFQSIEWEEVRHPFFLETALKPIRLGVTIHEIPASWQARQEGESQNSLLQTFKYLGIAFRARFERKEKILKKKAGASGGKS